MKVQRNIDSPEALEFAIFCVENVAVALGISGQEAYRLLTGKGDVLYGYVVPAYGALHTQGRGYIVDEILDVLKERGCLA